MNIWDPVVFRWREPVSMERAVRFNGEACASSGADIFTDIHLNTGTDCLLSIF